MARHARGRWGRRAGVVALAAAAAVPLTAQVSQADPAAVASQSPPGTVVVWGQGGGSAQPPAGLVATAVTSLDSYNNATNIAIRPDRTLVGWGSTAGDIPSGLTDVVAVDLGAGVGAALRADGSVVTWSNDPTLAVPANLGPVSAISAGGRRGVSGTNCGFVIALKTNGTVRGWGEKPNGVGCTNFVSQSRPPADLRQVVGIATGGQHALALCSDGTVVGWGLNDDGQATPPAGLDHVVQVAAGGSVSYALRDDGTVVQWGSTYGGTVPAGLRNVVSLQASESLAVALLADGSTVAWGYNAATIGTLPGGPGLSSVAAGELEIAALSVPTLVGSPRIGPFADTNPSGRAEAFRFTATSTAAAGKLSVYVDRRSTATQVQVGVYADAGGKPETLLTSATIAQPVAGDWNTVSVPGTTITSGQAYWLAVLAPNKTGMLRFRDLLDGQGSVTQTTAQTNLTILPTTWKTGSSYANGPASLFVAP